MPYTLDFRSIHQQGDTIPFDLRLVRRATGTVLGDDRDAEGEPPPKQREHQHCCASDACTERSSEGGSVGETVHELTERSTISRGSSSSCGSSNDAAVVTEAGISSCLSANRILGTRATELEMAMARLSELLILASPAATMAAGGSACLTAALVAISPALRTVAAIDDSGACFQNSIDGNSSGTGMVAELPPDSCLAAYVAEARNEVARQAPWRPPKACCRACHVRLWCMPWLTEGFCRKRLALKAAGHCDTPCVAFHSTPHQDAVAGILREGFDPAKCGRHDSGWYGRGTYFHTATPCGARGYENTFLALILKGRAYNAKQDRYHERDLQAGFDSHVADDRSMTGETVIFSRNQMLPVFLFALRT
eukprot:TRINITY_DN18736_c0_g1_i1.p1 TRINITY_DN18736_c0_g1~~TRINITY_DN18736_c0_g1_i1.p1  ORF type:complete len:366 (-),score=47.25 TRINITY_DN18736_c0_g1_i1:31-1128(-)